MSASEDFDALKAQITELRNALDGVTVEEWQAYNKVSAILGTNLGGLQLVNDGAEVAAFDAGGTHTSLIRFVHKCAMVGLFEPGPESGTSGAYDPATVQRFADLGG